MVNLPKIPTGQGAETLPEHDLTGDESWLSTTSPTPAEAQSVADAMASWSPWLPFSSALDSVPRLPGVYTLRLPVTHEIVYVGMAGPREGGRTPQGLRGRLAIYASGKGATSGFGEACLDRALAEESFIQAQLDALRDEGPTRAKGWAKAAIAWIAPEVRWATTEDGPSAKALEQQVETALRSHGIWNKPRRP